jgi:biotin-dependent carboxylase-like uncharacterized protein
LLIERVAGLATVQDLGRPGWMHEGIPAGGALVPKFLARANQAVGNPGSAAAVEIFGRLTVSCRQGPLALGREDGSVQRMAAGESLTIATPSSQRVAYLAVGGGLAVPVVCGGRGTLLVAGLGGHEGRPLRRGDRVAVGDGHALASSWGDDVGVEEAAEPAHDPIRVVAGPDLDRFGAGALATLTSGAFVVLPESDRVGTRLQGPSLERDGDDDGGSLPMVAGAIEVPAGGQAIVLGPDHPTTGGYPVLAVVARRDLGRFASRPVGARVRFRLI